MTEHVRRVVLTATVLLCAASASWTPARADVATAQAPAQTPAQTTAPATEQPAANEQIVPLTDQTFTPNTGAAPWSSDYRTREKDKSSLNYGVYNLGQCPIPGGKLMFTSNRNAHVPPRAGSARIAVASS